MLSPIWTAPVLSMTTSLHGSAYLPRIKEEEEAQGVIQVKEGVKLEGKLSQGRTQKNKKIQFKRGKLLGEERIDVMIGRVHVHVHACTCTCVVHVSLPIIVWLI